MSPLSPPCSLRCTTCTWPWYPDRYLPAEVPACAAEVRSWLTGPDRVLLIADEAGAVVGYAAVALSRRPASGLRPADCWATVDQLCVDAPHRGRGLGTALLDAVDHWAREHDATHVQLTVAAANGGARSLYSRVGFTPLNIRLSRPL